MSPELKEMRETREKRVEDWRAVFKLAESEKRQLAEAEIAECEEHRKTIEQLDQQIKSLTNLEEREASLRISAQPVLATDEPIASSDPAKNQLPAQRHEPLGEGGSEFQHFGDYLQAVHRSMRSGGTEDKRLKEYRATGSSEGLGADGGFLVQTDYHAEVIKRAYELSEIWTRITMKVQISANSNSVKLNAIDETSRATGSRWGAVQGYWMSEAGAKTASRPKLRQIELALKKLICMWYATDELLEDAAAMQSIASQAFAEELQFMTEDSVINGTGAGQPLGILNSGCLVTVAAETGQAAKTIQTENIVKMWARLWARSQLNSVWLVNQDVFPQLYTMGITVGTGGSPIFQPPGGLSQSPYSTLLGRPIIPVEYCATLGTVGDIILADLSEYVIAEKGGVKAASSIHVNFTYDETVFRWVFRIDGQPKWNAALTPFKGTNTVSPFVALAARA